MSVEDVGTVQPPGPEAPPRPTSVPPEAEWDAQTFQWHVIPRDAEGRSHGIVRSWRSDGQLASEYEHRAGELHGAFRRFHPDGSVAREGTYAGGRQNGLTKAHGYDGPGYTHEPLQQCCVPPGAWQLQHDFVDGRLEEARWYDRAGVQILPSGAPHPPRPEGVVRAAAFEEQTNQWVHREYDDQGLPHGSWRRWSREGVLRERDELRAGKAQGTWRRWDAAGTLTEECEWSQGRRTGAFWRLGVPAGLYADARVHEERGRFDGDQTVGAWTLLDERGRTLASFDLGAALDDAALLASPALSARGAWPETARALEAEGRPAEAIVAWARAAAAARDAAPLRTALARLALPRTQDAAASLAEDAVKRADGRLDAVVNALPAGADAPRLLRALASALEGREAVGLELVDAALLLDPTRADCRVTRALLAIHLGQPEVALAEAAALPPESAEQTEFLTAYARVIFSPFAFAPATHERRTAFPDVPEGPDQPLENVRLQIQKYATRLALLRAAVLERAPAAAAAPWLPPDMAALLPAGAVPLETWQFEEIVEDDEEGTADAPRREPEPKLVTVDERLVIEASTPLPTLLRNARREWFGLSWMCWGVGLDRVALPETIAPPEDFGQAAGLSIERLWRCRDRLVTGGLRALTQGVPGFQWEGLEIDLMPPLLAEIAADEYREMRAVFYWLCDEGVQSPWQDNVRTPD
jgi:antitoxin component YwqK of YwqJK toxin-antitoxin module